MTIRISYAARWLLLGGLGLSGCMSTSGPGIDPYFAGYHAANPAHGLTVPVPDRSALIEAEALAQPASPDPIAGAAETEGEIYSTYYRDPYDRRGGIRMNLSYHLYGPYRYGDLRSRHWLAHQRRWRQLPWYGYGYDPWYIDPWYIDPWYGHGQYGAYFDPWYAYGYDPWYYDPYYGGYTNAYNSFYGGYGHHYHGSTWYRDSDRADAGGQGTSRTRRPSNRRGLPIGPASQLATNGATGSAMTTTAGSQAGPSASRQRLAAAASKGSASSGKQSRGASRRRSAVTPRKERSSSGGSARQKSSARSSSDKGSKSSKTSRSRNRKP